MPNTFVNRSLQTLTPTLKPMTAAADPFRSAAQLQNQTTPALPASPATSSSRAGAVTRLMNQTLPTPPPGADPWAAAEVKIPTKSQTATPPPATDGSVVAPVSVGPSPQPKADVPAGAVPLTTQAPGKAVADPFALRRQAIEARLQEELQAREKAVKQRFASQGLDDSGILDARLRNAEVDARRAAAGDRNQVDIQEAEQAYQADQSALERALQEKVAMAGIEVTKRGQDISKETFYAGLQQAGELAKAGLSLQESQIKLQEKGMSQEDARFYAGMAQAKELALKGFTYQDAALELQRQGMSQQNAQYYAGLAQAKELATAGLNIQEAQLKLQEKGMTQEDARYYAGLAQAKDLAEKGLSLQETGLRLQEKGLDQQNAQYFAGLAQAGELARAGLSLQEQQLRLQEKGMTQQDAQFYAGLAQAKDLAEKGLSVEQVKIELTKKGMDQQNAQFYAQQAHEKSMYAVDTATSLGKAAIAAIDPKDPLYKQKVEAVIRQFFPEVANSVYGPGSAAQTQQQIEAKTLEQQKKEEAARKRSFLNMASNIRG